MERTTVFSSIRFSARRIAVALGLVAIVAVAFAPAAQADTFTFTSCHLSDGCGTATSFGTVTLTQTGTSVLFDVVLTSGDLFVETGAGGDYLFLFNDALAGSTVTGITATFNGGTVTVTGGLEGLTNQSPIHADGTGDFTAGIRCIVASSCNGASGIDVNDLHFTVTNATLAQLETKNANGNFFVADILCGQTGCTGLTGPVDVSTPPVPDGGTTVTLLGCALVGLESLRRRRRA
jgi:hypothetical protein